MSPASVCLLVHCEQAARPTPVVERYDLVVTRTV